MEQAAAILVQTIFNADRMQVLLTEATNPQAAAELLKPWFGAMLAMVRNADAFDQGPTAHQGT